MIKIHVENICQVFRRLVSHGDWDLASTGVQQSFGLSEIDAGKVLSGQAILRKINDEITLCPDEMHCDIAWVVRQYSDYIIGKFVYDKKVYRPYARIGSLTHADLNIVKERGIPPYVDNNAQQHELNIMRARTYCRNEKLDDVTYDFESKTWVLSELVQDAVFCYIPFQLMDQFDEFDFAGVKLPVINERPTINLEELVNKRKLFEKNKQLIRRRATQNGGWIELHDIEKDKVYSLPRNAWMTWVLGTEEARKRGIRWEPVNSPGIKAKEDSPSHTDWWGFTGYKLNDAYVRECNKFFYDQAALTYFTLTKKDIKVLTNTRAIENITAPVIHCMGPQDFSKIDSTIPQIVIIPQASSEYELAVYACSRSGGIVVTEVGGKLCHLAKLAREYGTSIIMIEDALRRIPECASYTLDITTRKPRL